LLKLIGKDIKYGYSIPIPLKSIKLIPGLEMAPMNVMAQNTIDKLGRIVPKDRLTHDQSWKWSSAHRLTAASNKSFCRNAAMASASDK
jgi:hypothetical protein